MYASVILFPKASNLNIAIHSEVCYFYTRSVVTLYTKEVVGSKSMDTKASFIGQMSDSILHLILPKNFYALRHVIQNYVCWYDLLVFVQAQLPSPPSTKNNFHEHNLKFIFQRKIGLHRLLFFSRQSWKPQKVTRRACSYFQFEPSNFRKVYRKGFSP
jgi:hypothetical protein